MNVITRYYLDGPIYTDPEGFGRDESTYDGVILEDDWADELEYEDDDDDDAEHEFYFRENRIFRGR